MNIIFQKHDQHWNEYVHIDSDVVFGNKEKLKVIVTPHIVTPSPTATFKIHSEIDKVCLQELYAHVSCYFLLNSNNLNVTPLGARRNMTSP